jgi:hypothetical protein
MGRLEEWLSHRARIVGLSWPDGVAAASDVAPETLHSIESTGTLRPLGRSTRAYVARTLRVSVRELEALAAGRIQWIADERVVDLDRLSPNAVRPLRPRAPKPFACQLSHGVPILGRVLGTGRVEHEDEWTAEDGRRLPVRYTGVPDAFALELTADTLPHCAGTCLAFQVLPPGELCDGELALITRGPPEAESALYRVGRVEPLSLRLRPAMVGIDQSLLVPLEQILRAARVIGSHGSVEKR